MVDAILVFGDVDENGYFTEVVIGRRIIPDRQYDYFFYTQDDGVLEDINLYHVDTETRELVKIDS